MLLLSSSGPIKTPVGACATAVESVEIGVDTIRTGKAKVVVVGGYDDFGEEGSFEFAQMRVSFAIYIARPRPMLKLKPQWEGSPKKCPGPLPAHAAASWRVTELACKS